MVEWWQRFVSRELARVRRDGPAALLWSVRITIAATASYVVGTLLFPGTQPLLAPLTAMLVVQVTPVSLLVLGVGAIGAEAAAGQRIAETLVGAIVGILATLVFPPKVVSGDAGRAIDGLADSVSGLLERAAEELDDMAETDRDRLRGAAREWLGDARRITHDIPQVGAVLLRAEEGRRLNVRAVRTPHVEPGLRQGLEALEHSAVSIRGLLRSVADAADDSWQEAESGAQVLHDLAQTFRELAAGIDAFGELVRNEAHVQVHLSEADIARLQEALEGMHHARARLDAAIASAQSPDLVELHSATRATVRRLQRELALDERVRRQLRLVPPRRRAPTARRPAPRPPIPTGPEAETQVLPPVPGKRPGPPPPAGPTPPPPSPPRR